MELKASKGNACMDGRKVQVILEWSSPTNDSELRSFLVCLIIIPGLSRHIVRKYHH